MGVTTPPSQKVSARGTLSKKNTFPGSRALQGAASLVVVTG